MDAILLSKLLGILTEGRLRVFILKMAMLGLPMANRVHTSQPCTHTGLGWSQHVSSGQLGTMADPDEVGTLPQLGSHAHPSKVPGLPSSSTSQRLAPTCFEGTHQGHIHVDPRKNKMPPSLPFRDHCDPGILATLPSPRTRSAEAKIAGVGLDKEGPAAAAAADRGCGSQRAHPPPGAGSQGSPGGE